MVEETGPWLEYWAQLRSSHWGAFHLLPLLPIVLNSRSIRGASQGSGGGFYSDQVCYGGWQRKDRLPVLRKGFWSAAISVLVIRSFNMNINARCFPNNDCRRLRPFAAP